MTFMSLPLVPGRLVLPEYYPTLARSVFLGAILSSNVTKGTRKIVLHFSGFVGGIMQGVMKTRHGSDIK